MIEGAVRLLGSGLSRARGGGKLTVLIYHRVLAEPDRLLPDEPDARAFAWQMQTLARNFRVLPLGEATELLGEGRLGPRAAAITFDDGYADNFTVALPILKRFRLPATFFVTTGYADGGRMWNDSVIEALRVIEPGNLDLRELGVGMHTVNDLASRCNAIAAVIAALKYRAPAERDDVSRRLVARCGKVPDDLMMTSEQIVGLGRAGMEIGAHTVTHSLLVTLADAEARREIAESRAWLRALTGQPVRVFAYPNGKPGTDYTRRDVELVRDLGFSGAVSTAWGVGMPGSDLLQVPRFTPWDRTPTRFLMRLMHNYTRTESERV